MGRGGALNPSSRHPLQPPQPLPPQHHPLVSTPLLSSLSKLTLVLTLASEIPIRGLQSQKEELLAPRVNQLRLVNAKLRSPAQTDRSQRHFIGPHDQLTY